MGVDVDITFMFYPNLQIMFRLKLKLQYENIFKIDLVVAIFHQITD